MSKHTPISANSMIRQFYHGLVLAIVGVVLFYSVAWGGGVWLYEGGTPDLGTAGAGRTALASDASTAGANPAGMTQLDRSQLLTAVQGLYVNSKFDTELSGFGTGIQYDWNKDVTVGAAYEYLDAGDAEIDQEGGPLQGSLKGDYGTNAIHFFAVNLIWKF